MVEWVEHFNHYANSWDTCMLISESYIWDIKSSKFGRNVIQISIYFKIENLLNYEFQEITLVESILSIQSTAHIFWREVKNYSLFVVYGFLSEISKKWDHIEN